MQTVPIAKPLRPKLGALLRDFPNRPGAWRVLAVHSIPVIGVARLGWSAGVVSLFFLLDILLTALAMSFAMTTHAMDEMPHVTGISRWLGFLMTWVIASVILAMLGLMPALMLGGVMIGSSAGLLEEAFASRSAVLAILVSIALHASHVKRWVAVENRRGSRDEMREVLSLVIFKGAAFGLVGAHIGVVLVMLGFAGQVMIVMLLAAILTAAEVYRAEVLAMLKINRAWHDQCEGVSKLPDAKASAGKKRKTRPQSRA
jgi:hypothetical protein